MNKKLLLCAGMLAAGGAAGFFLARLTAAVSDRNPQPESVTWVATLADAHVQETRRRAAGPANTRPSPGEKRRFALDLKTLEAILPEGPVNPNVLERLGLDAAQSEAVQKEIEAATSKFQGLEKAHAKIETDASGDQCVVIEAHAAASESLVEEIAASLRAAVPDERADVLARMIARAYEGGERDPALRRKVYFNDPDDPARLYDDQIVESALLENGDAGMFYYFDLEKGRARWGHLLDFGPNP